MKTIPELTNEARVWLGQPDRDKAIIILSEDYRFPALLSLLLEFEEDLSAALSDYTRSPDEAAMDRGGLASMRKLREAIETILTPAPEEKKPKDPPWVNKPEKEKS